MSHFPEVEGLDGYGKSDFQCKQAKNYCCQPSPCCLLLVSCLIYLGRSAHFLYFSFLNNIPVALLIIYLPNKFQLCLSFHDCISIHLGKIFIFFPGYTSLVPLLMHFLLTLAFDPEVYMQ